MQVHLSIAVSRKGIKKAEHLAVVIDGAKDLPANFGTNQQTPYGKDVRVRKTPCEALNLKTLPQLINVIQEFDAVSSGFGHREEETSAVMPLTR